MRLLRTHSTDWFVRETIGLLRRTLARLDVSSRTLFAIIDQGSCFAGTLFELALAADRSYMLLLPEDETQCAAHRALRDELRRVSDGESRDAHCRRASAASKQPVEAARRRGRRSSCPASLALELGLVTFAPDDIDWEDEVRIAIEERASLSPDALTGMEASLRFAGAETMETRIFGRLSAWQNWIFSGPTRSASRAR